MILASWIHHWNHPFQATHSCLFSFDLSQELLVYKLTSSSESDSSLDMTITWQRSFSSPLFAIDYLDMTGDGVCEIVVACLSGLHILQVTSQQLTQKLKHGW